MAGRRLLGRIAHLSVSRCKEVVSRGVLAAPLGTVTVAHAQAVGAMVRRQRRRPQRAPASKARALRRRLRLRDGAVTVSLPRWGSQGRQQRR